jgi:RNase P subunit RPR2
MTRVIASNPRTFGLEGAPDATYAGENHLGKGVDMADWPGGDCPACGEWMPPKQVHCRECRQLLNPELALSSVEIPEFVPLQELDAMVEVAPQGLFVACPKCGDELKIARKYLGERVQCKFCQAPFRLDPTNPKVRAADVYATCAHCQQQLRFAAKYVGVKVACRFCNGKLNVVSPSAS